MEKNKNKPPKFYTVLRIVGFSMLTIGLISLVLGIVLSTSEYGSDKLWLVIPGAMLSTMSFMPIIVSFSPAIEKAMIEKRRYIQNETKEDLTAIAETSADITKGAVKKTAQAVKEGLKDTKFCKYCGEQIDTDSVYCNKCGKKQ